MHLDSASFLGRVGDRFRPVIHHICVVWSISYACMVALHHWSVFAVLLFLSNCAILGGQGVLRGFPNRRRCFGDTGCSSFALGRGKIAWICPAQLPPRQWGWRCRRDRLAGCKTPHGGACARRRFRSERHQSEVSFLTNVTGFLLDSKKRAPRVCVHASVLFGRNA